MSQSEMLDFALQYVVAGHSYFESPLLQDASLNRSLRYQLCQSFSAIETQFGEVTRMQVVMLIESWILANNVNSKRKPFGHKDRLTTADG